MIGSSDAGGVNAALVAGDDERESVLAALADEKGVEVTTCERVDGTLAAVGDGRAAVVVVTDGEAYRTVREALPDVPVVVVAEADRRVVDDVVADSRAAYVDPEATLETVLPARLDGLVGAAGSTSAEVWELAGVADEAVVAFDLDTYAVLEANDVFFEQWGWDEDDLTDATLSDLHETDITHELRGQGRGAPGEEELEWIDADDPVDSLVANALGSRYDSREWHCHDTDGRGFKSTVRVLADAERGRGYLVATVPTRGSRDETPDDASMLRSLMEHVPMSVYFKDEQSRHVLVSEDVVEPFIESPEGKILHTPEDVLGKTDFDLYPDEGAAEGVEEDREVMETGRPLVDRLERVQPPHGRPLYFQTTKAPWYDAEGWVRGIIGVTADITEQKRREQELDRQNERLEEFASFVSHDLRNPLNVAKGRLDLYRQRGDEDELDTVAEMHDRMERLIEDVLTFTREGRRVEETEWLDPESLADDAWETVDTADATLEHDWDYRIAADAGRLARVLENLFRNAVEHGSTSPGSQARQDAVEHGSTSPDSQARQDAVEHAGEDVTVRLGTLDDETGFYVEDDGPGIPEDERDEVFERGVTTVSEGTGFGLAIVREIAEAHGWDISLTESDEGGARFEFTGVPRGSELTGAQAGA